MLSSQQRVRRHSAFGESNVPYRYWVTPSEPAAMRPAQRDTAPQVSQAAQRQIINACTQFGSAMEDNASASAAVMSVDSKLLRLPDHFIPMQFPFENRNINIRDCYSYYFDILWNDLFVNQKGSVLITGTPGIGKSIFYIYVLEKMKALLRDNIIVLASFTKQSKLISCMILAPGQLPVMLGKGQPIPSMENAVYFYDGVPDVVEQGKVKTVVFASPNHNFLKEHSKNETMNNYYMPLWSEREIIEAVELLELRLEYDFIQKLFLRFCGSVRSILTENEKFRKKGLQTQGKAIISIESFKEVSQ